MIEKIKNEIERLETEQNIRIFYAVESGSRAWGFESKNSNWDVRFIYIHPLDWYLSIEEKKDNIEIILPNDIDLAGWDIRKALLLFRKSNPPLLEWLRSPIIYQENGSAAKELRSATANYFNPKSCLYHYFHMARGNYEVYFKTKEVRLKKYFYVLRPILACMWIERTNSMAPMEFEILMQCELKDKEVIYEINQLLIKKRSGDEMDKGARIEILDTFLLNKLAYYDDFLKKFKYVLIPDFKELNTIFKNSLREAWGT